MTDGAVNCSGFWIRWALALRSANIHHTAKTGDFPLLEKYVSPVGSYTIEYARGSCLYSLNGRTYIARSHLNGKYDRIVNMLDAMCCKISQVDSNNHAIH
jgi:hypothetical protein